MMKKIHIAVWLSLASLLLVACFEDDSKDNYQDLDEVVIEGIASKYSKVSHQDVLSITPKVTTKAEVEYVWELWSAGRQTGVIPRPDTIGRAKDLNYEVMETPGTYYLVFNVKDVKTGVTTTYKSDFDVVTINSTGWYLLKDEGSGEKYTDYDFIYDGGRINNWIAFYNDGKKLKGEAVKSIFVPKYSREIGSNLYDYVCMLTPVAREEIAFVELNSGVVERSFESLFFDLPVNKDFRNIGVSNNGNEIHLINGNDFYFMNAQGAGSFYSSYGEYSVAGYRLNGLQGPILFDNKSESFMYITYGNFNRYIESSTAPVSCNNMNAELIWASSINFKVQTSGVNGFAWLAYSLMKKHADPASYMLVKISAAGYGNSNPIKQVDALPATSGLVTAEMRAVNADYGIIYYVKDHKLYKYIIDNQHEEPILDLPAGEEVTCMQHIAYPNLMATDFGSEINCFAIATYANGKYKVWLHEFDAGDLKPLDEPTFEGSGRVACVNYVEGSTSNFLF